MGMDWVPVDSYGSVFNLAPDSSVVVSMYSLLGTTSDTRGIFEETDDFFIERVVGRVSIFNQDSEAVDSFIPTVARVMPLQADYTTSTLQLPWDPSGALSNLILDGDIANTRFWWERLQYVETPRSAAFLVGVEPHWQIDHHPWWGQIDIRPRQKFGSRLNLWPGLVVFNGSENDAIQFRMNARMLIKRGRS